MTTPPAHQPPQGQQPQQPQQPHGYPQQQPYGQGRQTPYGQGPQLPYGQPPRPPIAPTGSGSSAIARLLSAVAGVVLSLLLILLGAGMSGAAYFRLSRFDMRPEALVPIIAFGLGAVLVAFLLAMSIRLSSAGAYAGAAVLFVIGLLALLTPRLAFRISVTLGRAFRGGDVFVVSGMPILLAALLAGAGVAASMIRRQRRTPVSRS